MRYPILCLDMDGTILKTDFDVVRAHQYASDRLGIKNPPLDMPHLFIGPSNDTYLRVSLGITDEEQIMTYCQLYEKKYQQISMENCRPYDGMIELIRDANQSGTKVYVCTAKEEKAALYLAEYFGFSLFLSGITGARTPDDEKTNILCRLLDNYQLNSNSVAMIGDRYTDIEGGKNNGTRTVGVLYGYGLREELEACNPDYIAETVADLRDYLWE